MTSEQFKIILVLLILSYIGLLFSISDIGILVDGSASMKGFSETGEIQAFVDRLVSIASNSKLSTETQLFYNVRDGSKITYSALLPASSLKPSLFYGTYTVLDKPLEEKGSTYPAVVFITDNVDNSSGEVSTSRFYQSIQNTERMRQLSVIPLIRPFRGNPYVNNAPVIYSGMRGMMAYLIVYDNDYAKYRRFRENIINQGFDLLHFYPIGSEQLSISPTQGIESPYFLKNYSVKYILTRNKRSQLARAFLTRTDNDIEFAFDLSSRFKHFVFKEGTRVKIDNLIVESSVGKIPLNVRYKISPSCFRQDLRDDGVIQSFEGVLKIKPNTSISQELVIALTQPTIRVSFDIILEAADHGLRLSPQTWTAYFSDEERDLDKIFSQEDLLAIINPYGDRIRLKVQNLNNPKYPESTIKLTSKYASWLILAIIAVILALILVLYIAIMYYSVKPIKLLVENRELLIQPHSRHSELQFSVYNGTRVRVEVSGKGWHMENRPRSRYSHIIVPGTNYTIVNQDYTQRISFKYIKS